MDRREGEREERERMCVREREGSKKKERYE